MRQIHILWQVKSSGDIYFTKFLRDSMADYMIFCKTGLHRTRSSKKWNFLTQLTSIRSSTTELPDSAIVDEIQYDAHLSHERLSKKHIADAIKEIDDESLHVVVSGPFRFVEGMVETLSSLKFPLDRLALLDFAYLLEQDNIPTEGTGEVLSLAGGASIFFAEEPKIDVDTTKEGGYDVALSSEWEVDSESRHKSEFVTQEIEFVERNLLAETIMD